MEKEQLFQTIEAYLDGALAGEELAAFERELATDETLAAEVQLHRNLQRQLGDASKMRLRATLETVGREFPAPDAGTEGGLSSGTGGASGGGVPFWWWGVAFFFIIGGGVTWYLLTDDEGSAAASTEVVTEPAATETPAVDAPPPAPETPAEPEEAPSAAEPTPPPAEPPQAFNTIRELELLIGADPPSRRYVFSDGTMNFMAQGNQSYLTYSGTLTTSRSVDEGFFLSLYAGQYPEGEVLRVPLTFSEVNTDGPIAFAAKKEYVAAYSGETDLKPALYYGVVTVGDSSVPLWVGTLRVE